MSSARLPPAFAELEPFANTWCLATETERFERRLASSMEDLVAFYNAFFPRLEEAIEFCDKYSLDDLSTDVEHLLQLIYSMITVSMAVEIFRQPRTISAADAVLLRIREPRP
jgi:hypothetical protein